MFFKNKSRHSFAYYLLLKFRLTVSLWAAHELQYDSDNSTTKKEIGIGLML